MEILKNVKYEVLDNMLIVTLPDGVKDNSQYEIKTNNNKDK